MTTNNWIPVSERLPENGQTVLISYRRGHDEQVTLAWIYKGSLETKWMGILRDEYYPDFWMPLPEAPPKPDPFEEWWLLTPVSSDLTMKEWCRIAWRVALKSKEHA